MGWTYQHAIFYKGKFGDEVDRKNVICYLPKDLAEVIMRS